MSKKLANDSGNARSESLLGVMAPYLIVLVLIVVTVAAVFDKYVAQVYSAEVTALVCAGAIIIPIVFVFVILWLAHSQHQIDYPPKE